MDDKFFQILESDEFHRGEWRRHHVLRGDGNISMRISEDEATQRGGGAAGKFSGGLHVVAGWLKAGARAAFEAVTSKMKPVENKRVNYGNCPDGYNLEAVGEDEEYILTQCSGKGHFLFLVKKTVKNETSNGGFTKDNTVAEIMGGDKYAR